MVEANVEMTPEPSSDINGAVLINTCDDNDEDSMQVDQSAKSSQTIQPVLKKQSTTERIRLFPKLDSKMCIATMLGYLLTWEQTPGFFNCLHKRGGEYF